MSTNDRPNRDPVVDCWRGLLMLLVVIGHTVGGASHLVSEDSTRNVLEFIYKLIYSFHMPAFFLLAGYVWSGRDESYLRFALRKSSRLLVPYFVFGIMSIALYHIGMEYILSVHSSAADSYYAGKCGSSVLHSLAGLFSFGSWPQYEAYRYNSVLWFLPCMLITLLIYYLINAVCRKWSLCAVPLAVLFLALSVVAGLCTRGNYPFSINRVPLFIFMMMVGQAIRTIENATRPLEDGRWFMLVFGSCLLFCGMCYIAPNTILTQEDATWALYYTGLAVVGGLLSKMLSSYLKTSLLVNMGKASLVIMLLHKFFVVGAEMAVPVVKTGLRSGISSAILTCGAVVAASVVASMFVGRLLNRFCPWCLNGVEK